ncbi:MAG: aquaporin [Phycisphaerales bacterium]|nr:aquaporin [Phycisphaerales bacterium]
MLSARETLAAHWPEFLIEGGLLGVFMISACASVVAFHHPDSPLARRVRRPLARRGIVGLLMGLTAVGLIHSPAGQRSGAHMNPATTLAFLVLGKVPLWTAVFYILAQCAGGLAGVVVGNGLLRGRAGHPEVNYAVTAPGPRGAPIAWVAEFMISLIMMMMVLLTSNHAASAPYTGVLAGVLVSIYITCEAPLSGMSMNPARSLASAVAARTWRGLWVYLTAPPLGMLAAAALYTSVPGGSVFCAKLDHPRDDQCVFNCDIGAMPGRRVNPPAAGHISDERRPAGE